MTIISRSIIVLSSFGLVVMSTQLFGSEGRGIIALIIANISIIVILNNSCAGSTVIFHAPKIQMAQIIKTSWIGSFFISLIGSMLFILWGNPEWFWHMFTISFLMAVNNSMAFWWLGKKRIKTYNLLTLAPSVIIFCLLGALLLTTHTVELNHFFYAYYVAYAVVILAALPKLLKMAEKTSSLPKFQEVKSIFTYGIKNEFNYFIQFINYRLSYFFISFMLGAESLGVFSVAIAITESIWIISKSLSSLHFTHVINSNNQQDNIETTTYQAKLSFVVSLIAVFALALVPTHVFTFIFGQGFEQVKLLTLYLIPGIIFIAVSNLHGHYFAAINRLDILRNKSLLGLVASVIFLPLLLRPYELVGACIALNISYITSSVFLFVAFKNAKKTTKY
ncbi:MAG: hypothetical protein EA361_00060 [Bacteroidetes bacterium]|nr:MAG: hypothetical protein EA361_00060 [Bacteroidota bacterium]